MNKLCASFLLLIALVFLISGAAQAETINFESDSIGPLPSDWTSAMTHSGGPPQWEIVRDDTSPSQPHVLAQLSSDNTRRRYPLAVLNKVSGKNGDLRVKFKAVSGEVDASGGLVWRYLDENNYYVVRANALEDNLVLYKVENGNRSSLAPKGTARETYGVGTKVSAQTWHTIRVAFQGSLFTVYFNGEKLFEVEDTTFTAAGKVGLWTKADSVTHFDDFQVVVK
ncbi:MAG: hypothetical protein O7A06_09060 [Acidobacteria bacterium]|nr:hypothetical protein [Acidobacteriota bacterium]MCZ6753623.1 hypothetical protein [Acidobacteriota bacterium]